MSLSTINAERTEVDDKITRLEDELRFLRQRHNDLTLAGRLPSELLLHIFAYCRDIDEWTGAPTAAPAAAAPPPGRLPCMDWMRVTHVCARWRAAALGDSALWTRLSVHKHVTMGILELVLARSGEWELALELHHLDDARLVRRALDEWDRVRELRMVDVENDVLRECAGLLQRPTALLRTLHVEHKDINRAGELNLPFYNFLGRSAPSLVEASIDRADPAWLPSLPNRGALQSLHLAVNSLIPVVVLMEDLPNLRSLSLNSSSKRALSLPWSPLPDSLSPRLCKLTDLRLFCSVEAVIGLLEKLMMPALSKLDIVLPIEVEASQGHREKFRRVGAFLAKFHQGGLFPLLQGLDQLHVHDSRVVVSDGESHGASLSIRVEWSDNLGGSDVTSVWYYYALPSILNGLSLDSILGCEWNNPSDHPLEDYDRWHGKPWAKVAPHLTSLRTLKLLTLGSPVALIEEDKDPRVLYPKLHTLMVDCDDTTIRKWVFNRWRRGSPVKELRVLPHPSIVSNLRELRPLVERLEIASW